MQKRALITGITGQDGSYLAELLIEKGYEVYGLVRRTSGDAFGYIEPLRLKGLIQTIPGNLRDTSTLEHALRKAKPDEIYNLGSQSHVGLSFELEEETYATNYTAACNLVTRALEQNPSVRIYHASSSEMFGETPGPQTETSPFNPITPYGHAKAAAHNALKDIRTETGAFIAMGILYNHESPRRGKNFVTRKISHSFAKIALGMQEHLEIGNPNSQRDWGFAKDYVEAMWQMLQQPKPDDYIIASGILHSVREFINTAAQAIGMQLTWQGDGLHTRALDQNGIMRVRVNEQFYRRNDPQNLLGDTTKAKNVLGWKPRMSFEELVEHMVRHDIHEIRNHDL